MPARDFFAPSEKNRAESSSCSAWGSEAARHPGHLILAHTDGAINTMRRRPEVTRLEGTGLSDLNLPISATRSLKNSRPFCSHSKGHPEELLVRR